jgi:hypothetical protein
VYEHGLKFSRSGYPLKTYRVNPLLYPQFGVSNKYFLPKERDLPAHGLVTRFYVFDFGYSNPGNQIAPLNTAYSPLVAGRDFLVWAVTGVYNVAAPQVLTNPATTPYGVGANQLGANQSPGFLINFLHTHNDVQRQWSNKNITDGESVGSGRLPLMLKDPALIPQGDTITCVLQNLSNVTLAAQVVFAGGEFDTESYGQEAGV